eukprot:Rhum_TRINITY_DN14932_c13_g10::Rhum_TRINITY_DN14932_c13_g10_i1::g.129736::m.129736
MRESQVSAYVIASVSVLVLVHPHRHVVGVDGRDDTALEETARVLSRHLEPLQALEVHVVEETKVHVRHHHRPGHHAGLAHALQQLRVQHLALREHRGREHLAAHHHGLHHLGEPAQPHQVRHLRVGVRVVHSEIGGAARGVVRAVGGRLADGRVRAALGTARRHGAALAFPRLDDLRGTRDVRHRLQDQLPKLRNVALLQKLRGVLPELARAVLRNRRLQTAGSGRSGGGRGTLLGRSGCSPGGGERTRVLRPRLVATSACGRRSRSGSSGGRSRGGGAGGSRGGGRRLSRRRRLRGLTGSRCGRRLGGLGFALRLLAPVVRALGLVTLPVLLLTLGVAVLGLTARARLQTEVLNLEVLLRSAALRAL